MTSQTPKGLAHVSNAFAKEWLIHSFSGNNVSEAGMK